MNKSIVITIVAVVILIAGAFIFLRPTPSMTDTDSMQQDDSMMNEDSAIDNQVPTSEKTGAYVNYYEGILDEYADKKIVLFFYANWCPTCQPVDREIGRRAAEIPDDTVIINVNYNDTDTDANEEALAERFSVTYQHTFVVLENGQEVAKWNGDGFDRIISEL